MAEIRLGLERITNLLRLLENPHLSLKAVVHVAGTNGKGSVCALLASCFKESGLKTARFSSPHFLHPTDSICINGCPISLDTYSHLSDQIKSVVSASMHLDPPSNFEIECALAFLWFSMEKVDVAVIEVGLGGRLDATNVFTNALCVFTALAIDHTEFLGSTIQEIAAQKAGILHAPCTDCILGPQDSFPEAKDVIRARALEVGGCSVWDVTKGCERVDVKEERTTTHKTNLVKGSVFGQDIIVDLPLLGLFQYNNLATVLETLTQFYCNKYKSLFPNQPSLETIKRGIESTTWPGRMEFISPPSTAKTLATSSSSSSYRILTDGAHNEQGAECLRAYLDTMLTENYNLKTSIHWIIGMKNDKSKMQSLLRVLVRPGDVVWTVGFESPVGMPWIKCMDGSDIVKGVQELGYGNPVREVRGGVEEVFEELEELVKLEQEQGKCGSDTLFVVCGSLYLMASLHRFLQEK
ncbi:Mur ligase [Obelidium mucronatum]|nr:Mur ligase [Obelidium mucronatum]